MLYSSRNKKYLMIAVVILIFSTLLNFFAFGTTKTYSWLNDSKAVKGKAEIAVGDNIIKSAIIKYPKSGISNQSVDELPMIVITKSKECKASPIIYFELTGKLPYYIQHINPIELDKTDRYDADGNLLYFVPVRAKVNLQEKLYFEKLNENSSSKEYVLGNIVLKYLNDYIKKDIEIKYTVGDLYNSRNYSNDNKNFPNVNPIEIKNVMSEIKSVKLEPSLNDSIQPNPASSQTPYKIIITKSDNCKSDPIVFFELTGQLSYYVLHMNPIKLSNNTTEVPINVKCNIFQNTKNIEGQINILCSDKKYDKPISLKYTKDQLDKSTSSSSLDPNLISKNYNIFTNQN